MGLALTVLPTAEPVSIDEAAAHCRVDEGENLPLLTAQIVAARQFAETFTNRQLITATYELTLDAFPCWEIRIPRPPLQSITSITYIDENGDEQTLSSSLYLVDTDPQAGRITPAYNQTWPCTRCQINAVTVTFVAGYGDAEDVPQGIKSAILLTAGHWYNNREAVSPEATQAIPLGVDALLWQYKVWP